MEFTDEQKRVAARMFRDYEDRIEMIWDDMKFDLGMQLNLDDAAVDDLMSEVL